MESGITPQPEHPALLPLRFKKIGRSSSTGENKDAGIGLSDNSGYHQSQLKTGTKASQSRHVAWADLKESTRRQKPEDVYMWSGTKDVWCNPSLPLWESELDQNQITKFRATAKSLSLEEWRKLQTPVLPAVQYTSSLNLDTGDANDIGLDHVERFLQGDQQYSSLTSQPDHFLADKYILTRLLKYIMVTQSCNDHRDKALRDYQLRIDMLDRLKSLPLNHVVRRASECYRQKLAPGHLSSPSSSKSSQDTTVEEQAMRTLIQCCDEHLDNAGLSRVRSYAQKHREDYHSPCLLATILGNSHGFQPPYAPRVGQLTQSLPTRSVENHVNPYSFPSSVPKYSRRWQAETQLVPLSLPLSHREQATRMGHTYSEVLRYYHRQAVEQECEVQSERSHDFPYQQPASSPTKKRGLENEGSHTEQSYPEDRLKRIAHLKHHQQKSQAIPPSSVSAQQRDYQMQLLYLERQNKRRLLLQKDLTQDQISINNPQVQRSSNAEQELQQQLRLLLSDNYNKDCVITDHSLLLFKRPYKLSLHEDLPNELRGSFRQDLQHIWTWNMQRHDLINDLYEHQKKSITTSKNANQPEPVGQPAGQLEYQRQLELLEAQCRQRHETQRRCISSTSRSSEVPSRSERSPLQQMRSRQHTVRSLEEYFKRMHLMPLDWPFSCDRLDIQHETQVLTAAQEEIEINKIWVTMKSSILRRWASDEACWPCASFGPHSEQDVQRELSTLVDERQQLSVEILQAKDADQSTEYIYKSMVYASFAHCIGIVRDHSKAIVGSKLQVRLEVYKRVIHLFEFLIVTLEKDFDDPFTYTSQPKDKIQATRLIRSFLARARQEFKRYFSEREDSSWQPLAQFLVSDIDVDRSHQLLRDYFPLYDESTRHSSMFPSENETYTIRTHAANTDVGSSVPRYVADKTDQQKYQSFTFVHENPGFGCEGEPVDEDSDMNDSEDEDDSNYDSWTTDRDENENDMDEEDSNDLDSVNTQNDENEKSEEFFDAPITGSDQHDIMTDVGTTESVFDSDSVRDTSHDQRSNASLERIRDAHVQPAAHYFDTASCNQRRAPEYATRHLHPSDIHSRMATTTNTSHPHTDAQDGSEIGRALFIECPVPLLFTSTTESALPNSSNKVTMAKNEGDDTYDNDDDFVMVHKNTVSIISSDEETEDDTQAFDMLSPVSPQLNPASPLSNASCSDSDMEIL